jgi:putative hydrolase of the HAD superfamily
MISKIDRMQSAQGILFDLDNTLYPREKGVFPLINEKINEYVRRKTGRNDQDVDLLRKDYQKRYGTTLGGLIHHHYIDPVEYLDFVHDVPVEELLSPDPSLTDLLGSIKLPMVIFTNGSKSHAVRVLEAMEIASFFSGICDLVSTGYLGKPHQEAFETAADFLDCSLHRTIFIDDLPINVKAGGAVGAVSIHVNGYGNGEGDLQVRKVIDLASIFSPMPWYKNQ